MARSIILLVLLAVACSVHAQHRRVQLNTDTGKVVLHHFTTGQVSTREWTDLNGYWGRSWAYNRSGEVIFEGQTRRVAGHASVRFSYHPNGAVSKVETSDAPDGGIQWYRSTTTFDPDGNRTSFREDGRDDYGPIPRLFEPPRTIPTVEPVTPIPVQPPKQEVVACQRMFQSELFVVNPTTAAVRVVATPKETSPGLPGGTYTMAPGDTIRIGTFSKGEVWPEWKTMLELNIVQVVLGDRHKAVACIRTDARLLSEERRQLHVVIEGWAGANEEVHPTQEPAPPVQVEPTGDEPARKRGWRWRLRLGR